MSDDQKTLLDKINELQPKVFCEVTTDKQSTDLRRADMKIRELYWDLIDEDPEKYTVEFCDYLYSYITSNNELKGHESEFCRCIGMLSNYPALNFPNESKYLELYKKNGLYIGTLCIFAEKLLDEHEYQRAIKYYNAFFDMDINHEDGRNNEITWMKYISAITELDGVDAAVSAFKDVMQYKPASARIRNEAAKFFIENEMFSDALEVSKTQMLNEQSVKYHSSHYYWNAVSLIDQAYTGLGRDDALERIFNCDALLTINSSVEAAVGTVDDVVALYKNN